MGTTGKLLRNVNSGTVHVTFNCQTVNTLKKKFSISTKIIDVLHFLDNEVQF